MKKILQIANYMFPVIGGVGQVAQDISSCLKSLNCDQHIICFNDDAIQGEHQTFQHETMKDTVDGVDVTRCGVSFKIGSQSISLSYCKKLKEIISSFHPDIIILHYPNPFLSFFLLRYIPSNCKLIIYWHSDIIKQRLLRKFFVYQNYSLLKRAWKIVATSPNYVEGSSYLSKYKSKVVIIPNCVREDNLIITEDDTKQVEAIRTQYDNKVVCFALGRHVPYKGYEFLIKASQLLDDRFQIIIGSDGPLTPMLKEMASTDSKVVFTGQLSRKEVKTYLMACDIFCFPSITKNEAFGIALAEGMYYGKPAVTFTIPGSGVNYVSINKITGIECSNRNTEEYAAALNKLASDSSLRREYGKNAEERVKEMFLFPQFSENIRSLLEL